jgi:Fe-S-cluster-containing dehydrogenase component
MRRGFVFDNNKCVGCNACSAACILENGWSIQPRKIFTYNADSIPTLPVTNVSLACNHCEVPACLEGCPTSAYSKEPLTGAIILDDKKCIGCKYCQWNCPYDAPKPDISEKTIVKCNLCYSELIKGQFPACTSACPTGALNYSYLNEPANENIFSWFPDKNLNPGFKFTGMQYNVPLRVIPAVITKQAISFPVENYSSLKGKWSLAIFSFLTTISVSLLVSSLFKSKFPDKVLFFTILIFAGLISLFHLGIKQRAWRVLSNLRNSPLSREIALFILYSVIAGSAVLFLNPFGMIASSIIGLILLFAIDSVYIFSDKRISVILHSGQTFLSALLIVSFFTGAVLPFVFIALLKIISTCHCLFINRTEGVYFAMRFASVSILVISGASIISGISYSGTVIYIIFLAGEFVDRLLYYIDFDPVNINTLINKK